MMRKLRLLLFGALLAACQSEEEGVGREVGLQQSSPSAEESMLEAQVAHQLNSKINGYIAVNNAFLQIWAAEEREDSAIMESNEAAFLWNRLYKALPEEEQDSRVEQSLQAFSEEAVAEGDFTRIRPINEYEALYYELNRTLNRYQEVDLGELDRVGYMLRDRLREGLPQWRQLQEYNALKRYLDDEGVLGQALLPNYIETREAVIALWPTFNQAVEEVSSTQKESFLAQLTVAEDPLLTHTVYAMDLARSLITLLQSEANMGDHEQIARADHYIETIEQHLTQLEQLLSEPENQSRLGREPIIYPAVLQSLQAFTQTYWEGREEPKARKRDQLIKYYNNAASYYNGLMPKAL